MNKEGVFSWKNRALASALELSESDTIKLFQDGRRISFIIERKVARDVLSGTLANSEGASYDVIDPEGGKWEVRCITKYGINFCPSKMIGSGRHFEEKGFLEKLHEIKGYFVADIILFPNVPYWKILSETVLEWWKNKKIGKNAKISRKKALNLIESY